MTSPAGSADELGAGPGEPSADDELERLRSLILTIEQERLDDIERRLDDPETRAEELAHVMPEALARAAHDGNRLALALSPPVEEALGVSIRKNRAHLAEALAPAMGPAIRRAIAETLRAMVDSFNQVLQHSFSPRALRWRMEAWRTGRPFAEVVLTHSLVYRVEQVFLIHRKSGLLLQHVTADPSIGQDGDLVSGMLTAIQDFVRDSFSVDAEQAVDTMRVGDLTVWVEQAEEAYVAAVVRGSPPVSLRGVLRDALETIHLELAEAFETYSGDTAAFEGARHHLDGCLQMQVQGARERRYWLAPALVAGSLALVLAVWGGLSWRAARRWHAALARLAAEPGIVVVRERGGIRHSEVSGLRDPYAADPAKILTDSGFDATSVSARWEPFVSQNPAMVLARAGAVLQPPASVTLAFSGGVLTATGTAPHAWASTVAARAPTVPGVVALDAHALTDEGLAAVAKGVARLGTLILRFDVGSAELSARELAPLDEAAATVQELGTTARDVGVAVRVDIVGHTDGTGSEGTNVRLSRARAEWVLSALEARGARGVTLAILGVGASQPLRSEATESDRAFNRSVTFSATVAP